MVEITDINSFGAGVGRIDGIATFVPYTITGEKVEAEITKKQKKFQYAKLNKIIEKSPHRRTTSCQYYGICGGCSLMHIDYKEQLHIKETILSSTLDRIGKTNCQINSIIGAESELSYRNKAAFPVKDGKIGYYSSGSHDIVPIDSCPLVCDEINNVLKTIKPFIAKYGENLNHVVVRSTNGQTMITAVTSAINYKYKKQLIDALMPIKPDSINLNYNNNKKIILGAKTETIYGNKNIPYTILNNTFNVSPTAFLQVNNAQADMLYKTAINAANLNGKTVIDAYCGIGTISLAIAKKAKNVIGIEINPHSVENARLSAKLNSIDNATFVCGKCEDIIPKLLKDKPDISTIIVDPPRAGLDESLITTIEQSGINEIVYISCDPSSLARDISRFNQYGYEVMSVTPVDMFPNTPHIETVCLLSRKEK